MIPVTPVLRYRYALPLLTNKPFPLTLNTAEGTAEWSADQLREPPRGAEGRCRSCRLLSDLWEDRKGAII